MIKLLLSGVRYVFTLPEAVEFGKVKGLRVDDTNRKGVSKNPLNNDYKSQKRKSKR